MQEILIYYFRETYLFNVMLISIAIYITIVIMFIISYNIQNELNNVKKITLDKFMDTCDTGDIIITRWEYVDIGYRLFCKYCHVCIVYKNNMGEKFLIETHPPEFDEDDINMKFPTSGVNMYPLRERVSNYQGTCYFLKLKNNNKKIKTLDFNKYKDIPFPTDFRYSFLKNWFYNKYGNNSTKNDNDNDNDNDKTMYCSELCGHILQDIGILNKNIKINTLSPDSFEFLKENNETLYNKPVCIMNENETMIHQIKILEDNLENVKFKLEN